jgi:thiamine pyrophosphate-dependent acetolactate synthase large subunit-like protein
LESAPIATGAALLVECLYLHGVRRIFGMPGSHSTSIYDAICQHGRIETTLCRNEQAGAFMADGYARVTGRPGVLCTTAGPGATNALTGIAEAYSDSVPVLLIAGQINHDRIGQESGRYHEMDLESIFRPCTRFADTVLSNEEIPATLNRAFHAMLAGRPGPAAIFLPQDLMAAPAEAAAEASPAGLLRIQPNEAAIQSVVNLLSQSARPVILAGGGAISSGAGPELEELARKLDCPVMTTLNGKGAVDERSLYSLGHGRTRQARMVLRRADLLLAAGCRFTEVFTASWTLPIPKTLIQIDIQPDQITRNYPVTLGIAGDARSVLAAMLAAMPQRKGDWSVTWRRARNARQLKPEWIIDTLREQIPESSIVFADASEMGLRMHTDFPAYAPRTFFYPSNYATLGWGLAAAIGGAVAKPEGWTMCVCGDGGFMMAAQELATAVRYRLKLIVVIHNDSTYGAIKAIQNKRHESRYIDTELNNPDFVEFARSFGMTAYRADALQSFAAALRQARQADGPSLIEIPDKWRSLRI